MAAKRNKAAEAEAEAVVTEEVVAEAAPVEAAKNDTPAEPAPEKAINADEMAANVKVSGNDYQQYYRQMMKARLKD